MGRIGFALACGVLLAGTSAQAQVSNITESASTQFYFPLQDDPIDTFGESKGAFYSLSPFGGGDYRSYVDVGDTSISFESADVVSGTGVQARSKTLVAFDFLNTSTDAVKFDSLITPAGMGFYMANIDPMCQFSSCPEAVGARLSDLTLSNPGSPNLGKVKFEFAIQDNGEDLYRVMGSIALRIGPGGYYIDSHLADASSKLLNFGQSTVASDNAILGYAWDATPVSFLLEQGLHHLTYSTSVFSGSGASPVSCGASLVSFVGFGDPIGRGGGVESADVDAAEFSSFARGGAFEPSASSVTGSACPSALPGSGGLQGFNSTPTTFNKPIFRDGVLTYGLKTSAAVPEPATWAMMILGFGALGTAARRRRTVGARA